GKAMLGSLVTFVKKRSQIERKRKNYHPVIELLEDRFLLAGKTWIWDGESNQGTHLWRDPANWNDGGNGTGVPGPGDTAILDKRAALKNQDVIADQKITVASLIIDTGFVGRLTCDQDFTVTNKFTQRDGTIDLFSHFLFVNGVTNEWSGGTIKVGIVA